MCKLQFIIFIVLQARYIGPVMPKPVRMRPMLKLSDFHQNVYNKYYERSQIHLTYKPYKPVKLNFEKRQKCGPPNFPDISCEHIETCTTKLANGMILLNKEGYTTQKPMWLTGATGKKSMDKKKHTTSDSTKSHDITKKEHQNNKSIEPTLDSQKEEDAYPRKEEEDISVLYNNKENNDMSEPHHTKELEDIPLLDYSKENEDISKPHHSKETEDAPILGKNTKTEVVPEHQNSKEKEASSKHHSKKKEDTTKHSDSKQKDDAPNQHHGKEKDDSKDTSKDPSITSSTSAPYVEGKSPTNEPSLQEHVTRCSNLAKCDIHEWPTS